MFLSCFVSVQNVQHVACMGENKKILKKQLQTAGHGQSSSLGIG